MPLYRDEGIVLRTQKLGEADRIVTLLTRGLGKVRVVGKGVRRTKSRFGARLEPAMTIILIADENDCQNRQVRGSAWVTVMASAMSRTATRPARAPVSRAGQAR